MRIRDIAGGEIRCPSSRPRQWPAADDILFVLRSLPTLYTLFPWRASDANNRLRRLNALHIPGDCRAQPATDVCMLCDSSAHADRALQSCWFKQFATELRLLHQHSKAGLGLQCSSYELRGQTNVRRMWENREPYSRCFMSTIDYEIDRRQRIKHSWAWLGPLHLQLGLNIMIVNPGKTRETRDLLNSAAQ